MVGPKQGVVGLSNQTLATNHHGDRLTSGGQVLHHLTGHDLHDFIASLPERVEAGVLLERALEDLAIALEGCAALGVPEGAAAARLIRSLDVPLLLILPPHQLNELLRQLTSRAAALSKCLPSANIT